MGSNQSHKSHVETSSLATDSVEVTPLSCFWNIWTKTKRKKLHNTEHTQLPTITAEEMGKYRLNSSSTLRGSYHSQLIRNQPSFRLIEAPTPNFVGRETYINEIHSVLSKCANMEAFSDRIVVLYGLGGMGKSELARKYVESNIDDPIIQNVGWINAETKDSLKASFITLSQKLSLLVTNRMETEEIVAKFYEHFSEHVGTGLLIFDNVEQLRDSSPYFGILNFLPTQLLRRRPLILITSRTNDWHIPNDAKNIIPIIELGESASVNFLINEFRLSKDQKDNENIMGAVRNLANAVQGYPLGLSLAASNIRCKDWIDIAAEIEKYIKKLTVPKGGWIDDKHSSGCATKYQLVMNNVWNATFQKIKQMGQEGECALVLLNLMAYLPADHISKENIEEIVELCYGDISSFSQSAFSILVSYSLISINPLGRHKHQIKIHRHVQRCTRESLDSMDDHEYLFAICKYLSDLDRPNSEHLICVHKYLKQRNWPERSERYSIVFSLKCILNQKSTKAFGIICDVNDWLEMNPSLRTKILGPDFTALYDSCLLEFCWDQKYCDHRIFQNPSQCLETLEQKFVTYLNSHVRHLVPSQDCDLVCSSNIWDQYVDKHLPTIYYIYFHKLQKNTRNKIGELFLSALNSISADQNLATQITKLYSLFRNFYLDVLIPTRGLYLKAVIKKHLEVYSTLEQSTRKQLYTYWNEGPLEYFPIWMKLQREKDFFWKEMFADTFFAEGGPQLLTHHLNYFMTCPRLESNCVHLLYVITNLAHGFSCDKFVQDSDFMDSLCKFTTRLFKLEHKDIHEHKFVCLMIWFGLFPSNDVVKDRNGLEWSISSVSKEMGLFMQDSNPTSGSNVFTISFREIAAKILTRFKMAVTSEQNSVAVGAAKLMLQILER